MSYTLCFWSERPGAGLAPKTVYERLLDDGEVDGLVPLPVDAYLEALASAFPGGTREPNATSEWFVWEGASSMFEVWWSAVHVLVIMRPLDEDNATHAPACARLPGSVEPPRRGRSLGDRLGSFGHRSPLPARSRTLSRASPRLCGQLRPEPRASESSRLRPRERSQHPQEPARSRS
jgi:hypothetical protein